MATFAGYRRIEVEAWRDGDKVRYTIYRVGRVGRRPLSVGSISTDNVEAGVLATFASVPNVSLELD